MKKYLLVALMTIIAAQAQASTQDLIESVKQKNMPMLLELLANGENVNGKNEQGNTALHYAVALDDAESTETLLSYGADMNIANGKGWTPLKIAEKKQVKNVAPLLAKYSSATAPQVAVENATPVVEKAEAVVAQPQPVVAQQAEETVPLRKYNEDIALRDEAAQAILNQKLEAE
ncbi:MAG: ankyrin repeat domain-containing protein, partial [Alphaproteobacteria bacterium]|nr:ankyrin repeat domain-containing protein [Alphaproteobacteria bacterium]